MNGSRTSLRRRPTTVDEGADRSRDLALAHATAVTGLVGVFADQGLVPKLWKVDRAAGPPDPLTHRG